MTNEGKTGRAMTAEDLSTMTTDILLAMREEWRWQAKAISTLADQAEWEILRRLETEGATVYLSTEWEARVKPGVRSYSYRMAVLAQLRDLLRPGEYEGIVHERLEYDVDKVKLNALPKRGKVIAEIIEAAVIVTEGRPRLDPKRIEVATLEEEK